MYFMHVDPFTTLCTDTTSWSLLVGSSGMCRHSSSLRYNTCPSKILPFLAVTYAVLANWEYMDVIPLAADPKCPNPVNTITTTDSLLKFAPSA
ncbi:hypothetical protein BJV78DRAFT_247470 [Lactifluus subvellereus]|nr:hypothetical protein BJV78DRAFT_247470 [Lactifluus subvellereus]